ncbi:MAG: choice-of-anchor D domain-containing protein [bacterium]
MEKRRYPPGTRNIAFLTVVLLFCIWPRSISAQTLVINEFLAGNKTILFDQSGESSDWIELYNAGSQQIDLAGFTITDDPQDPAQWTFPSVALSPGEYLIVWASGKDMTRRELHTTFKLNRGGDFIGLYDPSGNVVDSLTFGGQRDDISMSRSPNGSGDFQLTTIVTPAEANVIAPPSVERPPIVVNEFLASNDETSFDDDGDSSDWLELYNFGEVAVNLDGMTLTDDEKNQDRWRLPAVNLDAGAFLLVWASGKDRRDSKGKRLHTNFKLSAGGEYVGIYAGDGLLIDGFKFGMQSQDVSMARIPDGSGEFEPSDHPTPGESNVRNLPPSAIVDFSPPSGFFNNSVEVTLSSNDDGAAIRYTTDGSAVTNSSAKYKNSISISSTTVIRARAFDGSTPVSDDISHIYVIDYEGHLPVLSLATDRPHLYGSKGIFSHPKKRGRGWERPVSVNLIEPDGGSFRINAGVRVHGAHSRTFPKKSMRLYFRTDYGESKLRYRLFKQKKIKEFDQLVVHSGGTFDQYFDSDVWTLLRDPLNHTLLGEIGGKVSAHKPVILFINGELWGIYLFRERIHDDYLTQNYGVDDPDLLEWAFQETPDVKEGDLKAWKKLYAFFQNNDMDGSSEFEDAQALIDLDNFIDYNIIQIYGGHKDWPHNNNFFYRERSNDGKWHWILWDSESTYRRSKIKTLQWATRARPRTDISGSDSEEQLFATIYLRKLLENKTFKARFVSRFADLLNTTLHPDHIHDVFDQLVAEIEPDISIETERWDAPESEWRNGLAEVRNFITTREEIQWQHVQAFFRAGDIVELTVNLSEPGAGQVRVNTVAHSDLPWSGRYFKNIPVELEALPAPGFEFSRWSGASSSSQSSIKLNLSRDKNITAHFEQTGGLQPPPTLDFFRPDSGGPGTVVTISGANFGGATRVSFNNVNADFSVQSDAEISATVPGGATSGRIRVVTPAGTGTSATDFVVAEIKNDPPVTQDDAFTGDEDTRLEAAAPGVLDNDLDPDGDRLTAFKVSDPANGSVNIDGDGSFVYTPKRDFNGQDVFSYGVDDGRGKRDTAVVTITVEPVNDLPVAANDAYTGDENSVLQVAAPGVLANDVDVDGDPLTAQVVGLPSHGDLTLNSDGSFSYIPASDFAGSDSFTYRARDGQGESGVATVELAIGLPSEVRFTPISDARVKSTSPSENFGSETTFRVRSGHRSYHSFLKFDLTDIGVVNSARLRLYVTDGGPGGGRISVASNTYQGSGTPWDEDGVVWNNAPEINKTITTLGQVTADKWIEIEVTGVIAGAGFYSFAMEGTTTNAVRYSSKEGSHAPELIVETFAGGGGGGSSDVPDIAVVPASIDFGSVTVGTSVSRQLEIKNEGSAALSIAATTLRGPDAQVFSVLTGGGSFTLSPGATRGLEIAFVPSAVGVSNASLRIDNDDPDENLLDIPLSGNGLGTPVPNLAVQPLAHDYGVVVVGTSVPANFQLHNDGAADLVVSSVTLAGPDTADYRLSAGALPFTLTAGQMREVEVTFHPTVAGARLSNLTIESNDPDQSLVEVSLTGNGVASSSGGGGTVSFEEIRNGGATGSSTVSTALELSGVAGHLYLAAISFRPSTEVLSVSGLGLPWTRVRAQCSGRGATGVEVWRALGTPTGSGAVTATFDGGVSSAVISVARYSGVDPAQPLGEVVFGNTHGEAGRCSGGADTPAYEFSLSPVGAGAVVYGATALRNRRHTPGSGYTERDEGSAGRGGNTAGLAVQDRSVASASTVRLAGAFNKRVDWAVIGVEIRPGSSGDSGGGDSADIAVAPASHDFGEVTVGSAVSHGFQVHNTGTADLVVSATDLIGPDGGEFAVVSGGGSFTLSSGSSREIEVRFTPGTEGAKSGSLRLSSNDPDENPLLVALTGTGVGVAAVPDITAEPSELNFGDVMVGESATRTVEIRNDGAVDLSVSTTTIVGGDAGAFTLVSGGGAIVLPPTVRRFIEIRFSPGSDGAKRAALRIVSNDPDENPFEVALHGNSGVGAQPDIATTLAAIDFGSVPLGTRALRAFEVHNEGTADLEVTATTISGLHAGDFSLESGAAVFSLAPGASRTVEVGFVPGAAGDRNATLQLTSNDPDESPLQLPLTGAGLEGQSGGGAVFFEEMRNGGATGSSTVSTALELSGVAGHLYLAAISFRPSTEVLSVSGLGLPWTRVRAQCSGRGATGVEVWRALGTPTGSGAVTATFDGGVSSAVISVARYSGVDPAQPLGEVVFGNTHGEAGRCSGGADTPAYEFSLSPVGAGAVVYGATALRNRRHTPGSGYTERDEGSAGRGGNTAGLAVQDRSVASASTVRLAGAFNKRVDWAVIGVEIRPGSSGDSGGGDSADIAVAPASHDFGEVTVGSAVSHGFQVHNTGTADLVVSATDLIGPDGGEFAVVSGGGSFTLSSGSSREIEVRFTPGTEGAKSGSLRLSSNDPDENPLLVALTGTGVGVAAVPDITAEPSELNFGDVMVGESATRTVEIRNDGAVDLSVSTTTIVGGDAGAFTLVSGGGAIVLPPTVRRFIQIRFSPGSEGAKRAALHIVSDDPDENPFEVALLGTGVGQSQGGAQVAYEETQNGGSTSSNTVTTAGPLSGVNGHLYLAAITFRPSAEVVSVSGLGLTWTRVRAQCSGRGVTGVELWRAQGTTSGDGGVTATLATTVTSALISVSRYSGVEGANPIGNLAFGNSNGVDGVCTGGTDNSAYQFDMSITRAGGMVFGAIALRNRKHNPGNGYTERDQVYSGIGGSKAGIAIQDRLLSTASSVLFAGTLHKAVDWAVVALELRPLSATATAQALNLKAAPEAVNGSVVLPERFSLLQNYPNPFNAATTIEYALPVAANVRITIFNLKGQTVRTLVDEYQEAGIKKMKWDGRNTSNLVVGSDIYLLRAEIGGRVFSRKIVLQK